MNNEPVAWMSNGKEFYVQKNYCPDFIPLYTHPVKDKPHPKCDEACMYLCQMRELTDEEIGQIWKDCMESPYMQVSNPVGFARAILRKASEK